MLSINSINTGQTASKESVITLRNIAITLAVIGIIALVTYLIFHYTSASTVDSHHTCVDDSWYFDYQNMCWGGN